MHEHLCGAPQIQSDERVHLDLLGQTLDGHDLDLLRIGKSSADILRTVSTDLRMSPPAPLQMLYFAAGFPPPPQESEFNVDNSCCRSSW